ncbi:hypothetical protein Tco_0073745 [Tanacetum coccineum]
MGCWRIRPLVFRVPFSLTALKIVVQRAGLHMGPLKLNDLTSWLIPMWSKRSLKSVVSRLIFAASVHFIWEEAKIRFVTVKSLTFGPKGNRAIVCYQAPLAGPKPADMTDAKYNSQDEKAHSTILLSLSDEVLYEVANEETAAEGSSLKEHLDALNSILMDLKNVEVKIEDEDAALVLLVSLPPSFESFVSSFVVGKDTITLEDVRSSLHSRELHQQASGSGGYES